MFNSRSYLPLICRKNGWAPALGCDSNITEVRVTRDDTSRNSRVRYNFTLAICQATENEYNSSRGMMVIRSYRHDCLIVYPFHQSLLYWNCQWFLQITRPGDFWLATVKRRATSSTHSEADRDQYRHGFHRHSFFSCCKPSPPPIPTPLRRREYWIGWWVAPGHFENLILMRKKLWFQYLYSSWDIYVYMDESWDEVRHVLVHADPESRWSLRISSPSLHEASCTNIPRYITIKLLLSKRFMSG